MRYVLAWAVSITLATRFYLEALDQALRHGSLEIFNTDQGAQFTSQEFTSRLASTGIRMSMDGRGRAIDNVFVKRLWRSVTYEEDYLKDYGSINAAIRGLAAYFLDHGRLLCLVPEVERGEGSAVKITSLEIIKVPPSWVWLKIRTDGHLIGLGEPYLENHAESVIAEVRRLEPLLLGQDPRQIERLWQTMYEGGLGYKGGPITMSAISGIDMALWDLAGKAVGVPVYELLGGAYRDRIKVYRATGGMPYCVEPGRPYRAGTPSPSKHAPDSPELWAEGARVLVQEWGFRCLKVHFGPGDGLEVTSSVDSLVERFVAVRAAAGPDVDVAVDIHNPHPAIAMQLIEGLAPYRPLFVEEPMPVERVDILAQIATRSTAPIAAGERWMGKWIFFDALSRGALAVVQPDIAHAGGITECKKIAALAEAAYAKVALHCPLSPLSLAASVQIDACIPNFLAQEHNEVNDWRANGHTYIGKGYFRDPFVLDAEGCISVPSGPGLGVELDEDGLRDIMACEWSSIRG